MSIEKNFDIAFTAAAAMREKQIQQHYRPVIGIHKWFARRPGTLFRALILSEFTRGDLADSFYRTQDLNDISILDPFMGGGTPVMEADRLGCSVLGCDVNPLAYWIVSRTLEPLDVSAYLRAADRLCASLEAQIACYYTTRCIHCSAPARVKYFLWVTTADCPACGASTDLFPGYLLAAADRHRAYVYICPDCGKLLETPRRTRYPKCPDCKRTVPAQGSAGKSKAVCSECKETIRYPVAGNGPPKRRLFALEYWCPECKPAHSGRFFKQADAEDLECFAAAEHELEALTPAFIPDEAIPHGTETDRLLRRGYSRWSDLFNPRQLLGLEKLGRLTAEQADPAVQRALVANTSDLLRYQNMLCRYDTSSLKSLDIFSIHGFPVGLIQCESNLLGTLDDAGRLIGSGGLRNMIAKYAAAKEYCRAPYEIRTGNDHNRGRKEKVYLQERIGPAPGKDHQTRLLFSDAATLDIAPESLDGIFTDPPYMGNICYAELSEFFTVWLKRLLPHEPAFQTFSSNETSAEIGENADPVSFAEGLSRIFCRLAPGLKPGAPLVFTYHHNKLEAYAPLVAAVCAAGLHCTAVLPCPAEMVASIHISGTTSSVLDGVFVCRRPIPGSPAPPPETPAQAAATTPDDLKQIAHAGHIPTPGDMRCRLYGRLTRAAILALADELSALHDTKARVDRIMEWFRESRPEELLNSILHNGNTATAKKRA